MTRWKDAIRMAVRESGCKNGKCMIMLQVLGTVGKDNGRLREK
jgi:hypothetical protein